MNDRIMVYHRRSYGLPENVPGIDTRIHARAGGRGGVMTDPTHIPVWRTVPPKQCWYRRRDHVCTLYQAWNDDELICDNDDEHPAKCPTEIKPKGR